MTNEAGPIRDGGEPVPGTGADSSPVGSAKLSDFEILREIGRGGQSIVYEAQQLSLRRKVALKRLPSAAVFDQRWRARFQNEVRVAAQLNHPNIVAFLETGRDDDSYFYTMQLVNGISLAEVTRHLRQCRESVDDSTRPCRSPASSAVHPALLRLCERCRCSLASPGAGTSPSRGNDCDILPGHSYHKATADVGAAVRGSGKTSRCAPCNDPSIVTILLVASVIIGWWIAARERALAQSAQREHEKDLQLLADLDRAWSAQAELDAQRTGFDLTRAGPILKRALREYGLAIGEGEPREAAASTFRSGCRASLAR